MGFQVPQPLTERLKERFMNSNKSNKRGVKWALLVVAAAAMVGLGGVIDPRNKSVRMPSRFGPQQTEMCERERR
jgi:hypothetical protein